MAVRAFGCHSDGVHGAEASKYESDPSTRPITITPYPPRASHRGAKPSGRPSGVAAVSYADLIISAAPTAHGVRATMTNAGEVLPEEGLSDSGAV